MRVTSKGQVTIPQAIREKAGFLPHTEVEFEFDGRAVKIVKSRKSAGRTRGGALAARLRGRGDVRLTTDEIMALTRGR
jgi:bifunctional DNA-binding transcriptional regulator/antitoxin component of YhaV-PrlF toxin-antitoxin module